MVWKEWPHGGDYIHEHQVKEEVNQNPKWCRVEPYGEIFHELEGDPQEQDEQKRENNRNTQEQVKSHNH